MSLPDFSIKHAQALHFSTLVVDLHADTPMLLRCGYDLGQRHDPLLPAAAAGFHLDLPRLREGGVGVQYFGLIAPPPWLPKRAAQWASVDKQIDALQAAADRYADQFVIAREIKQIEAGRAAGKIVAMCGIEGAQALGGDLTLVEHFAKRQVSYLGLLHFSANEAGAPAYGLGRDQQQGLTSWGHDLVAELNRCRMLVDLAHINRRGFLEAAAASHAPVIVSHTGVSGAHDHWRNIDDEQIRVVARSGGVIGVIFGRRYLGDAAIDGVCAHLRHLIQVGGDDIAALGSDYDGLVTPPAGLEDASCLPNLTRALLKHNFTEEQIRKILGGNVQRVWREVAK